MEFLCLIKISIQSLIHHGGKILWKGLGNNGNHPITSEADQRKSNEIIAGDHKKILRALFHNAHDLTKISRCFLDANEPLRSMSEPQRGFSRDVGTCSSRNIINDNWQRRCFRKTHIMLIDSFLRRLIVIWTY